MRAHRARPPIQPTMNDANVKANASSHSCSPTGTPMRSTRAQARERE